MLLSSRLYSPERFEGVRTARLPSYHKRGCEMAGIYHDCPPTWQDAQVSTRWRSYMYVLRDHSETIAFPDWRYAR